MRRAPPTLTVRDAGSQNHVRGEFRNYPVETTSGDGGVREERSVDGCMHERLHAAERREGADLVLSHLHGTPVGDRLEHGLWCALVFEACWTGALRRRRARNAGE